MKLIPHVEKQAALTLVETLVVVAILGILATLIIPSFISASSSASRAKSTANLKNFGTALHSFAADNNGILPGATGGNAGTLSGISPLAKSSAANSLQVQLMSYLERDRPSGNNWGIHFIRSLAYPAWQTFNGGTNDNGIPAYIACQSYPMPDGTSLSPFGGPDPTMKPLRLPALQSRLDQFSTGEVKPYAVIETDQALYESVTWNSPGWKDRLSTNALHGKARNVLYFDGSVVAVPVDRKPLPW